MADLEVTPFRNQDYEHKVLWSLSIMMKMKKHLHNGKFKYNNLPQNSMGNSEQTTTVTPN